MAIKNYRLTTAQLDILDPATSQGVPAGERYAITNVLVCNTSTTDSATFDMHLVPNGVALSNQRTCVVRQLTLPASETFTFDSERIVLEEGDKIVFVAEPDVGSGQTDLAATVSYLEV